MSTLLSRTSYAAMRTSVLHTVCTLPFRSYRNKNKIGKYNDYCYLVHIEGLSNQHNYIRF